MRVVKAELKAIRKNGIDVKIHNGLMGFITSIDKENITFEDIVNHKVHTKVILLTKKCCSSTPMTILETGVKKEDDDEIEELLDRIIELTGEEIKEKLKK
ncbi:MAG: hypothetical protein KID00_10750 [Clostridium argentinense]|uniref:LSM domain-containing protein n=1 Tax=Clostridium faecium TaxID=2762223 RepID=A0ABR8YQX3_9CLOT|nr:MULTISPECIES: hypothetical protein [Clostridium]MBD8046650.1 hypothetical protein [Clostridium faecium]MBS5824316.1 hypothetical protein [Clostridium argentinense]MDU1349336.1 hypothetical protein [Clostridium argentinense]